LLHISRRVAGNAISDDGATALSAAVSSHASLSLLSLSCNHIGDEGAVAVAAVLRHSTVLSSVNLAGTHRGRCIFLSVHYCRVEVCGHTCSGTWSRTLVVPYSFTAVPA
jgi:hypothetical protein